MASKLPEEIRQRILLKIVEEPSDTKIAKEFGVSRKTVWRLRRPNPPIKAIPPPPPKEVKKLPEIDIPPPAAIPTVKSNDDENVVLPSLDGYIKKESEVRLTTPSVPMGTYFGIQLLPRETYKDVAYIVISAAEEAGIMFRKLQVLDLPSIGTTVFVRFRTDIKNIDPVLERIEGRAFISLENDAFTARFVNGKKGRFSTSAMCSSPKMGQGRMFHGTKLKRWKFQFKTADELSSMKNSL